MPSTPAPVERYWTVEEVAAIERVSKWTVYRAIWAGNLKAIKVGGRVRVPEAALNEYLAAAEHRGPEAPSAPR